MVVSSFAYRSVAIPSRGETTEPLHIGMFLSTFALCLAIGCLLMLPLAPQYRPVGTHYYAALLPLLFTWWGIILPVVTYWLFQQYVSTRWEEAITPQIHSTASGPGIIALDLPALQSADRRSSANHQKYDECILHMVRPREPRKTLAVTAGMDQKRIALPLLSHYPQRPCIVRAATLRRFREQQDERGPPKISQRQHISSILSHANPSYTAIDHGQPAWDDTYTTFTRASFLPHHFSANLMTNP